MALTPPNIEGTSNPASLDGGVFGSQIVSAFTPVSVANGGTVNLSNQVSWQVLRTTSDGTITGAVINLPTNVPDGFLFTVVSTGQITTVTGTVSTGSNPAVSEFLAGQGYTFLWNAAANTWFLAK